MDSEFWQDSVLEVNVYSSNSTIVLIIGIDIDICCSVPECVVEIVGSGGVEGIVNLMSQHGTHGGVCRAACMLLYNIAYQGI